MDLDGSLLLQNQIRDNSDDLQNFLRDMDHWEKDMKKKEAELKLMNVSDEQECPPIRNSLSRSKKRSHHKKKKDKSNSKATTETPAETKERISAFNYKAWEKFDVESELKKIDGEDGEKKESSASETSEEEEISVQSKKQLAIIKKDNGNKFFKAGKYDSAINCYTIGMELDPENALLPANRAMAFLKKEQFQAAENDCTLCLSLDPTYVKAYLRRGSARFGLKKLTLAQTDFLKALELEPDNKQAPLEIEKVNQELRKELSSFQADIMAKQGISDSKATSVNIEVMDEERVESEKPIKEDGFSKLDVTDQDEEFKMVIPTSKSLKDENVVRAPTASKAELDSPMEGIDTLLNETKLDSKEMYNGNLGVASSWQPTLPPIPTTSFQFFTDWKHISKYPELKYSYLKQLPPEDMQAIFKHHIEPELFPEILHTLSTFFIENGDDVYHYMKYLATVGRFNFMLMFLSEAEKKDLGILKSYLEISGYHSSDVNAVLKLYNLV